MRLEDDLLEDDRMEKDYEEMLRQEASRLKLQGYQAKVSYRPLYSQILLFVAPQKDAKQ